MAQAGVPAHYLPSLGLCLTRLGYPVEDARRLHLFCVLRDQMSAAIRLGLIGPTDGHELQAGCFRRCEELQRASAVKTYVDAARNAPLIDIHSRRITGPEGEAWTVLTIRERAGDAPRRTTRQPKRR